MISRTDIEATLRALLFHFQANADQGTTEIARFARAGAEALLLQMHMEPWLDSEAIHAQLGLTLEELVAQLQEGALPTRRGHDDQPRFHRRDLSLYWLNQQLGATEQQVTPLTEPGPWSDDGETTTLDPWLELTPG
jgi:hypothetical protein